MKKYDVIILGGGASGLMCALTAAARDKSVLVIEHAEKVGKKILISGGGKCNFTNLDVSSENFICQNKHFTKSALSRYSQYDFLALIDKYDIAYEERNLGQLFCLNSAKDILSMLKMECYQHNVEILTATVLGSLENSTDHFIVQTTENDYLANSFVVASGGISIPKMGATDIGYRLAKQFGHHIIQTDPALVPFEIEGRAQTIFKELSGNSIEAEVSCNNMSFRESLLLTHKGLSGPVILQISNYWYVGDEICIDFIPDMDLDSILEKSKDSRPQLELKTVIQQECQGILSKNFIKLWLEYLDDDQVITGKRLVNKKIAECSKSDLRKCCNIFKQWKVIPKKTQGFRLAEVTRGGINTDEVSSKTFESLKQKNLYFIGEVLDVTGWLGGYNFQWAWSSGYCAGLYV